MVSSEKAKMLVLNAALIIDEHYRLDFPKRTTKYKAKKGALMVVNEIQEALNVAMPAQVHIYWEDVIKEINKI